MLDQEREKLRAIKTFPSLVKYLRDELNWPIETDDFNEIVFDYAAEELGIDPETAVKIDEIKQLRPLVSNQPWGIFFIKFEPKRLPVVVLRRILSRLVFKKRASANKSEHASWNLDDLLFISNYGEDEQRQITFAHFSQDKAIGDLPTLKVLGWDDADTALHLDHCHRELKEKLLWPDDEHNLKDWCEKWSSTFVLRHREVITTSKDLASRLADLAKRIRSRTNMVLAIETERGHLRKLYKSFQEALIHDLSEDDFADMYAQTIAYGLLAARVSRPTGVTAGNVADMIPITNPFLKEILGTFLTAGGRKGAIDFDELGVQEVVELLNSPDTHMDAILRDFGNRTQQEDPVIHFYEDFLSEYDKKKKVQRGVFFTPQPVVSYIVHNVHELLQSEFGLEDGLADITTWGEMVKRKPDIKIPEGLSPDEPFVQILDPATGTATFLVEAIDLIHKTMRAKWVKQGHMALETQSLWNEYVPKHLLPRLYGFELMMAPYAIAHMKLGLKLYETGYSFNADERVHVYLTNSLEPATDSIPQRVFEQWAPALAHEARAVNNIKWNKRFTVIIANPPYSKISANMGEWAINLAKADVVDGVIVQSYYKVDGTPLNEKKLWLQDDYVKFIRLAQIQIGKTGVGTLGYISNHGFLGAPTFNGMRQSLMSSFSTIHIVNLHGDSNVGEQPPAGMSDVNVFDIQQGVAISLMCRSGTSLASKIHYSDVWGTREEKNSILSNPMISDFKTQLLTPQSSLYLFVP
ncbi:MAG: DNA methyltransferase, partial [Proteobacteria bacterium]|nr:DNA methyltransferase [Pseudomonadota bacterium]